MFETARGDGFAAKLVSLCVLSRVPLRDASTRDDLRVLGKSLFLVLLAMMMAMMMMLLLLLTVG